MKKFLRIFCFLNILFFVSVQNLKASHGLPIVNPTYTIGATGVTISGFSDPATCGSGPFWMQAKVACSPSVFANTPPDACLKSYLQNWSGTGTTYNSFPWYNSILNVPNYNAAASWPDQCALEPYNNIFIPYTDLCPGEVYYFAFREIVTGGAGSPGPFGPVVSFTVPGTPVPQVPGFVSSNPTTSPSNPSCGGGVVLTFNKPQGCGPVRNIVPGCPTCDTIVWRDPTGVIAVNTLTVLVNPTSTTTYTVAYDTCNPASKVGCGIPYNPNITVYVANVNAMFVGPPTLCAGSTANFMAMSPAPNELWTVSPTTSVNPSGGMGPVFSPTFDDPGTYVVTHQAMNGVCMAMQSQTIVITPGITASVSTSGGGCSGPSGFGSATVTVSSPTTGLTYSWSPSGGTGITENNIPFNTTYSVTLSNGGCVVTKTLQVSNNPPPVINSFSITAPTCNGLANGSMSVNFSGGNAPFSFAWTPSISQTTQTVTGVSAGTYSLIITDNNGCVADSFITVSEPAVLNLALNSNTTICYGNSTTLTSSVTGGTPVYSYSWTPGSASTSTSSIAVSPTTTTQYICTINDLNGCSTTQSVNVTVTPVLTTSAAIYSLCVGQSVVLTPSITSAGNGGPYTYSWTNGATTPTIEVSGSYVGTSNYGVTVSDGCTVPSASSSFTIVTNPSPIATIVADSVIGNAPLIVNFDDIGSGGNTFNWNFGNGNASNSQNPPTQVYPIGGTYMVTYTVTSSAGCSAYDTLTIVVLDLAPEIVIPNVFTPNGDKVNDTFAVKGTNIKTYECSIFNRWGKLVFNSSDITNSWDGKISGSIADEGTYFYIIKVKGAVGDDIKKQGYVSLFR